MSQLTPDQIYSLARQAGFPPDAATEMTAIALRESSGNTQALNPKAPDYSMGLWQINMLGNLEQYRVGLFNLSRKEDLYDPQVNAAAAYKLWSMAGGSPLRDWYEVPVRFMPQAEQARIDSGEGSYADLTTDPNTDWTGDGADVPGSAGENLQPSPSPLNQIANTLSNLSPVTVAIGLGALMLFVVMAGGSGGGARSEVYD